MAKEDLGWYWSSWEIKKKPSLSEWADAERYLSLESNPTGGKWKTDTIPYLREIMDTVTAERYEKIVWMAPSQVAKTETILNFVGYIMDVDPGPILLIQENLDNARSWSKDRFEPMLRDTPCLHDKVSKSRGIAAQEEVKSNEVLHKSFKSGHITCVGSNSGAGLSMRPIRYILADEVDAWAPSAGEEGDQLDLAEKRQAWFFNKKMVIISSPRLKATSRIEPLYLKSDQRKYFVPCPHCGHYQQLLWENFRWEKYESGKEAPETAHFACVSCNEQIEEKHKFAMITAGEWRAQNPESRIAGFWLWAAYSPVVPWATLAQEYIDSKDNPEKHKVYINTRRAETWEEKYDAPKWEIIRDRAEPYEQWVIPHGVGFLVAAGDVQDDRIEFSVWGFGRGEESWLIGHAGGLTAIYGNTDLDDPYLRFEQEAFKQLSQPTRGRHLQPLLAFLDSGAKTQQVYSFVRTRPHIYAIKGSNKQFAPAVASPTWQDIDYKGQKIKDGVQLWQLGVHRIKKLLYGRLKLTKPGPRYLHFPHNLSDEYYRQLTSEKLITHASGKEEFKKEGRNETLDCAVYGYAAGILAGLSDPRTNWDILCPLGDGERVASMPMPMQPITNQPPKQRGMRGGGGTMGQLLRG
jgi:phage terminase large subunit GpA-like protein